MEITLSREEIIKIIEQCSYTELGHDLVFSHWKDYLEPYGMVLESKK